MKKTPVDPADEVPVDIGPKGEIRSKAGPAASVEAMAEDIIRETESAVVRPPGVGADPSPTPAGPVDTYGRAFDPAIHLTKQDGITPAIRRGQLLVKPGMGLPKALRVKASPAGGATLDLEAAGLKPGAGAAGEPVVQAAPGEAVDQVAQYDPANIRAKAEADAQMIREGIEGLCKLLAGEKGELADKDVKKLDIRWEDALVENGWALPFGSLALALYESTRNIGRAAWTEEGKEKIRAGYAWLTGQPKPKTDGRPPVDKAAPPGKDTPPVQQSERRTGESMRESLPL